MSSTFHIGIVGSLQILSLDWKNKSQRIPKEKKMDNPQKITTQFSVN